MSESRAGAQPQHGNEQLREDSPTHWSTLLSLPVIDKSFLSSTVTSCPVSVLRTLKMSCSDARSQFHSFFLKIEQCTMVAQRWCKSGLQLRDLASKVST